MKYFTKEWYELCQSISLHFLLEEEKQAESFSEEYFLKLYYVKLNDWINLQQQVALHMTEHEKISEENTLNKPFEKEKAIEQFYNQFMHNQEYVKKALPYDILKEIADIRVFALNKASRKVINAVTKFCLENKHSVDRTMEQYRKYYRMAVQSFDKGMVESIRFHDCRIIKTDNSSGDLILHFDNTGGFTDINEVIFENYSIIKQDNLLEDSWWLYDEIYKVNDKYELHVLLQNKNMDLNDFIISVDNIVFNRNKINSM